MSACSYADKRGAEKLVDIFKALSEESRLRILSLLLDGELCVCEIESSLMLTQSNASRHLTTLKRSGILESCKNGQWTYYRISGRFVQANQGLWGYLEPRLRELPTSLADHEAYRVCKEQDLCNCNRNPHEKG
jgi:ArsR family transcriptional regulator